jgi:hypothetical protein
MILGKLEYKHNFGENKMKKIVFYAVLSILLIFSVSAQDNEQTVEEKYLSTSIEVSIIRELAYSDTRDQKLAAIESIEDMFSDGKIKKGDPQIHNILDSLSGEGIASVVKENNRKINYYPEVRRRACKLLGELGGEISRDTLIDITQKDDETMVLSQAVYALGIIGMNENNQALSAIAQVIEFDSIKLRVDDNLAIASLLAIEKIAKKNGGFEEEPDPFFIYRSIIKIKEGNYSPNVKKWADMLLERLKNY